MDITLALTGSLVGFLVGLTGMGGGALLTPFLILVIGARPVVAVGTDLAFSAITKVAGGYLHWRQGTVDLHLVGRLAKVSVPAGLLAVATLRLLPASGLDADAAVRRALGAVLIMTAVLMFMRIGNMLPGALRERWGLALQGRGTPAVGAFVGALVGFTSVGSGALLVPFLACVYPLSPARIVGTDVFHAAVLVTATAIGHAYGGTVDWPLAVTMLVGSIPGVALGSWMAPRLPTTALRASLASLLLVTGLTLV